MANPVALGEVFNQSRPVRRADKTYGKKKPALAQSRAMHLDLFGGRQEKTVLEKMGGLTLEDEKSEAVLEIVAADPVPAIEKDHRTDLNPRFRGRRKVHTSRRIAVSPHHDTQRVTRIGC